MIPTIAAVLVCVLANAVPSPGQPGVAPPAESTRPAAAAPAPTLAGAVVRANTEIKRSKDVERGDVLGMLGGVMSVRATLRECEDQPDGSVLARGSMVISRPVSYDTAPLERAAAAAQREVRAAEASSAAALRQFDGLWKPRTVRVQGRGERRYVRPGCQKRHPPMSESAHAQHRGAIVRKGEAQVAAAKSRLESLRERRRTEPQAAIVAARTVELAVRIPGDAPELAVVRLLGEVQLGVRVTGYRTGVDPPGVTSPSEHITSLELVLASEALTPVGAAPGAAEGPSDVVSAR